MENMVFWDLFNTIFLFLGGSPSDKFNDIFHGFQEPSSFLYLACGDVVVLYTNLHIPAICAFIMSDCYKSIRILKMDIRVSVFY